MGSLNSLEYYFVVVYNGTLYLVSSKAQLSIRILLINVAINFVCSVHDPLYL